MDIALENLIEPTELHLPSGGPMKLETSVAKLILAHLDAICAPDGSHTELLLTRKRNDILAAMDEDQRDNLYVVGLALTRLAQRKV